MKTQSRTEGRRHRCRQAFWLGCCLAGASLLVSSQEALAGETNKPMTAEQFFEGGTNTYNNWVEVGVGGFMVSGNSAQAQQRYRLNRGAFGGIQDLHYQQTVATNTTLTIDGHALFDEHDYKVNLDLRREDLWFLRFNYENFRTWYNGAGGYYPPTGVQYNLPDDELTLDRGEISFEAGLTLKDLPKFNLKYSHRYRDGQESSTVWGPVHPDPVNVPLLVRGLSPSFSDIDEATDAVQLDVSHHIKKTELGLGFRYETGELNDSLNSTFWQGQQSIDRKVTTEQGTSYDLLSVHAFSETWIKKNLLFTSGFLFANLDNTFTGNRIYGDDFDVGYKPNSLNGLGYVDLNGGSHKQEYVLNMNLMATPFTNFTIVPSIRVQEENWNADSFGLGTLGEGGTGSFAGNANRDALDVRERLDFRYNGVTNWVFYSGGEWTEGDGDLNETGGLGQVNGTYPPAVLRETSDTRLFQKYFVGARWYPTRRLTLDAGGYYKINDFNYDTTVDSTPNEVSSPNRYPAYLVMQGFETYDGNVRITLRPVQRVTMVTRYEYQYSTVHTTPDPVSGLGQVESSVMPSQIIGESISWVPWSRLSLQVGFNYVLSETQTPVSDYTQAILNAQNNYWTLNFTGTLVLDDKTDLSLGYFFYQADDYSNNAAFGVPYGAGAEEQTVTATLTRRISPRLRLNLKYAYTHYTDWASGGNNNYDAQVVYSSLQYRF